MILVSTDTVRQGTVDPKGLRSHRAICKQGAEFVPTGTGAQDGLRAVTAQAEEIEEAGNGAGLPTPPLPVGSQSGDLTPPGLRFLICQMGMTTR